HKLYDAINKCRGAAEIESTLAKMKRTDDETGAVLPDSQQYLWDKTYEVIMVWKLPFIRNPEGKKPEQDAIKVVRE
ncbi:hypothetical protein MUP79_08640, partial [Candidatus Bathyarchaeota archaeon]|nr:hypothetical protein [Candidatus Bathyarchaeota archaeon]